MSRLRPLADRDRRDSGDRGGGVSAGAELPWLGKLPGDLSFKRGNFSFYFPLGTCILISIILTLIMYLFRR